MFRSDARCACEYARHTYGAMVVSDVTVVRDVIGA